MGEQSRSPNQRRTRSHLRQESSSIATTATTTASAAAVAVAVATATNKLTPSSGAPPTTSTSSKIPFRPRKVRKLSSSASSGPDKSATANNNEIVVKEMRITPGIVARTLSCEGEIGNALRHLRSSDPILARVIDLHEPPVFDSFNPPFIALSKSIIFQQLASKAAHSIYTRFVSLCGGEATVVPETVLALTPHQLRQAGVSARKASYLHDLASKYSSGIISDDSIVDMDDKSLLALLTMVKGIGPWSVHMFLIFTLHRPDVLPVGDLGVRKGVQLLYGLEELPRPPQMEQLCEKWSPYRSVGSWYMWRIVEAKGAPAAAAGAEVTTVQQQAQAQSQSQLVDPINSITNLGPCDWDQ